MYSSPETLIYDATAPDACSVDIFSPSDASERPRDLLIFIHGGAWRTGDKSDHADIPDLVSRAAKHNRSSALPTIVIPNYRLSSHPDHPSRRAVVHPTHVADLARCVQHLVQRWNEWEQVRKVVLVGHSCGAHILSHLAFGLPALPGDADGAELRLAVATLMGKTTALAFLDGIYSLSALIEEYPTYRFFVDAAFGTDDRGLWEGGDVFNPRNEEVQDVPEETRRVGKIVVAHATEDELLTPAQGKLWVDYMTRVGLGKVVEWDETTLKGTHDGCLHHDGLGELLYKLIK